MNDSALGIYMIQECWPISNNPAYTILRQIRGSTSTIGDQQKRYTLGWLPLKWGHAHTVFDVSRKVNIETQTL